MKITFNNNYLITLGTSIKVDDALNGAVPRAALDAWLDEDRERREAFLEARKDAILGRIIREIQDNRLPELLDIDLSDLSAGTLRADMSVVLMPLGTRQE